MGRRNLGQDCNGRHAEVLLQGVQILRHAGKARLDRVGDPPRQDQPPLPYGGCSQQRVIQATQRNPTTSTTGSSSATARSAMNSRSLSGASQPPAPSTIT